MRAYITNINGIGGTAQTAQNMIADIAEKYFGIRPMGIYHYDWPQEPAEVRDGRMDGIIAPLQANDLVILQMPTWQPNEWTQALLNHMALYGVHVIIFIHDIMSQMVPEWADQLAGEIGVYNRAELIITHSQQMLDFLHDHGLTVKKTAILGIMDHPTKMDLGPLPTYQPVMTYAGPNDPKAAFIQAWDSNDVKLRIYDQPHDWGKDKNIDFIGWHEDAELLIDLRRNAGFGLVWSDVPYWNNYMKMNSSFKLSTYLAAGIPVIAKPTLTQAQMIKDHHLGILANDMHDAQQQVLAMSPEEYHQMVVDIDRFATNIREGNYTKRAFTNAFYKLFNN
ncbi:beta-1,6-galactofuranosyltransferase [Limosilactobacillus caecicola]|uniref:beta-1,6-galactofuranosyltransferase n=1 Tax=Limosilactobacillus caecicola TaxID=2941332 RepID=UPI00203DC4F3|nr:beta-1,6-galactofuranosyltransferase [Limosilactobacillus caecicola]